jgi:hypothetical protein
MHAMAQYAEQLKEWGNWSKMQNSEQIRRNKNKKKNNNNKKQNLDPRCTYVPTRVKTHALCCLGGDFC